MHESMHILCDTGGVTLRVGYGVTYKVTTLYPGEFYKLHRFLHLPLHFRTLNRVRVKSQCDAGTRAQVPQWALPLPGYGKDKGTTFYPGNFYTL